MEALTALNIVVSLARIRCSAAEIGDVERCANQIRGALVAATQKVAVVNPPLVTPPAAADLGKFELSTYHVGITRHEVAAAALDKIMARDFDMWDGLPAVAVHAKNAATEAWVYANALFEVGHTTEEQPS